VNNQNVIWGWIGELHREKAVLDRAIADLEQLQDAPTDLEQLQNAPTSKKRGRKSPMSEEERAAVSVRIRDYWSKRRERKMAVRVP
jgi:hypothetical protein